MKSLLTAVNDKAQHVADSNQPSQYDLLELRRDAAFDQEEQAKAGLKELIESTPNSVLASALNGLLEASIRESLWDDMDDDMEWW